jgi:hypothetical protein
MPTKKTERKPTKTTKQILKQTFALLNKGWTPGMLVGRGRKNQLCYCLEGALARADGAKLCSVKNQGEVSDLGLKLRNGEVAVDIIDPDNLSAAGRKAYFDLAEIIKRRQEIEYNGEADAEPLYEFNDFSNKKSVLEVVETAIALAEAK